MLLSMCRKPEKSVRMMADQTRINKDTGEEEEPNKVPKVRATARCAMLTQSSPKQRHGGPGKVKPEAGESVNSRERRKTKGKQRPQEPMRFPEYTNMEGQNPREWVRKTPERIVGKWTPSPTPD